jgi:intracellular multiplication protein IcmE
MGGFSAKELLDAGFTARELITGQFDIDDLKTAGFTAPKFKTDRFSARELKMGGFSAKELLDAGFTARELITGQFDIDDLKTAGLTLLDLKTGGLTARELSMGGFSLLDLIKLRQIQEGVDGYTDRDKNLTGYTLKELQEAKYDLLTNPDYDLNYIFKNAKYTYGEIKDAHAYYKKLNDDQKSQTGLTRYKMYDKILQDIYMILRTDKNEGCQRTKGIIAGIGKETPLNCVYNK